MSVYTYNQSGVIDEITFKKTANGGIRAYLHVGDKVSAPATDALKSELKKTKLLYTPYILDGKPTLEVRGFTGNWFTSGENKLTKFLHRKKLIAGSPHINLEKDDQIGWWEWFRKRTLQATGVTYLIGDVGLNYHANVEKDRLMKASAISYFIGTLSLLFFGRNDQSDLQVRLLAKDMEQFLAKEKMPLPEGSAMHTIVHERPKGILQSLNDFARRYPSEIFNSVTALAGVFLAAAAYKKVRYKGEPGISADTIKSVRQQGWWDIGLGTLTAASGTLATVIKEKKHDPDDPPATGLKWIWQKIREHPLAIAGAGYTVSTFCQAVSTFKAYRESSRTIAMESKKAIPNAVALEAAKERKKAVPGRALFVGMAWLSEGLLAISSKGHGEGVVSDLSVDQSAIAIAADYIVHQPVEKQDELIAKLGKFLGDRDELAMEDALVLKTLRQHVEAMRNNPRAQTLDVKKEQPVTVPAPAKTEIPSWHAKMAARDAAAVHMQPSV